MGNKIRAVWAPEGRGIALIGRAKAVAKGATTYRDQGQTTLSYTAMLSQEISLIQVDRRLSEGVGEHSKEATLPYQESILEPYITDLRRKRQPFWHNYGRAWQG